MKIFATIALLAALGVAGGCASSSGHSGTTQITLSGDIGAFVSGFYLQGEKRTDVSVTVPWSADVAGLSSIELRKANVNQTVIVELHYESAFARAGIGRTLRKGTSGIRAAVSNGFKVSTF